MTQPAPAPPRGPSARNKVIAAMVATGFAVVVAIVAITAFTGGGDAAPAEPAAAAPAAAPAGPLAPNLPFAMFDGSVATLASYQGRPLVVNFWASWCPSCVAEMSAAFRPVQEQLGDRVAFLGMNIQDERALALQLVEDTGVLFDLAEDPTGELYRELGGLGMPFTIFVNPAGEILESHNGPLTEGQLADKIAEHFAVP